MDELDNAPDEAVAARVACAVPCPGLPEVSDLLYWLDADGYPVRVDDLGIGGGRHLMQPENE